MPFDMSHDEDDGLSLGSEEEALEELMEDLESSEDRDYEQAELDFLARNNIYEDHFTEQMSMYGLSESDFH